MSRHFYRDPLPMSGDVIPAHDWPTVQPTPDPNRRDSAFQTPTIQVAISRRPRWSWSRSTGELHSRFLDSLASHELNSMLSDVWEKHGDGSVKAVVLHFFDPTWPQDHAGVLRAYGYQRSISHAGQGVDAVPEMAFVTTSPRLMKREATER